MILTGKAEEDFEKWFSDNYGKFETTSFQECTSAPLYQVYFDEIDLPKEIESALIIEFFDSIRCTGFKSLWAYSFDYYDVFKDNWSEHIQQAIKKANDLYNERN